MGQGIGQPSTEELLERLLSSSSPEAYLASLPEADRSFHRMLTTVAAAHGVSRARAIEDAGITTSYGYQVFSGVRNPSRDTVLMLVLGIRATLEETQALLTRASLGRLWAKDPRDAVIIFGIAHSWSRSRVDDELFGSGLPTLLRAE